MYDPPGFPHFAMQLSSLPKLLPFPPHPPYQKCSQCPVTMLYPQADMAASHGPFSIGRLHTLSETKKQNCEETVLLLLCTKI